MYPSLLALFASILLVNGHPGEEPHEEDHAVKLARREHQVAAARGLQACQHTQAYRDLQQRATKRRAVTAHTHRKVKRVDSSGTGHNETDSRTDITADSDSATVFGDSHTCILNPEGEVGPYYVKGELVRQDLREDQPGVPVVIDGQFIDVETCEPITTLYWDIWNCNSTGVYSGVVAMGNGNTDDASNVDTTHLRGIQKTDSDGVVQFKTIFPGHYQGRATHHHMVAWLDATINDNQTLTSDHAAHIGQLFWDQDLITQVEKTTPYSTNTVSITENSQDRVISDETQNSDSDPFFSYVQLGSDLSDGLFGWVTIGINTSATYAPTYSFEYTADGGVANGNSSNSGPGASGGGGPGGNSTSAPGGNGTAGGPMSGNGIADGGMMGGNGTGSTSGGSFTSGGSSGPSNTAGVASATASSVGSFSRTIWTGGLSAQFVSLVLVTVGFAAGMLFL